MKPTGHGERDLVRADGRVVPGACLVAILALLASVGCAGRTGPGNLPETNVLSAVEMRRLCPSAVAASVRIRLEPQSGPGATIDGTLRAILPDTLALSGRLGVFHPFFALRADADSVELLLHDARRYWVTARADEEWGQLNPSALARALGWALCPGDLLARLDDLRPSGGDTRMRLLQGRLRASPYLVELGIERRTALLVLLRIRSGDELVLELRQHDFRRSGSARVPGVVEIRIPPQGLVVRVEVLGLTTTRSGRPPEVGRLRPPGWEPAPPGESFLPIPSPGEDPG